MTTSDDTESGADRAHSEQPVEPPAQLSAESQGPDAPGRGQGRPAPGKGWRRLGRTAAVALAGSLVGGAAWAAATALLNSEIGYYAVGVGAFTGAATCLLAPMTGPRAAAVAAALSVVGIVLGKSLGIWWCVPYLTEQLAKNQNVMQDVALLRMMEDPDWDGTAWLESEDARAVWRKIVMEKLASSFDQAAEPESDLTLEERRELAAWFMHEKFSTWEILTLTWEPLDALWILLAMGAAWEIGVRRNPFRSNRAA
ncbi:MAG: hypothetical protein ACOC8E_00390 [Planctomycetota bacterium]